MMTRSNFPKQVTPAMKRPVKKAGKAPVKSAPPRKERKC